MRSAFLLLGLLILASVWVGPLPAMVDGEFAAHMIRHMGVVAAAAPLLALGLAGGRFDPVRAAPAMLAPIPASLVELGIVWAWHAPALHQLARHTRSGLVLEQASFLAGGLLVWCSALGGDAQMAAARRGAGIVGLVLTSMHMTLLGALLALSPRPLYVHAALQDQHLGGAIMLIGGGTAYLLGGVWLAAGLLRPVHS
jgi:putative membrane protein